MLVDVCCFDVLVVVLWPVALFWWWVDEWMHVDGCAVDVEVENVECLQLAVERFGGCLRWSVANEADDFFVGSVEWLEVCCVGLV